MVNDKINRMHEKRHHVICIIPLHELALFIKFKFSVDLCVRLFEHQAALLCKRERIVFNSSIGKFLTNH